MKRNIREIYYAFGGKMVGTEEMKQYVCSVVALMEDDVVSYITSNCWFFGESHIYILSERGVGRR